MSGRLTPEQEARGAGLFGEGRSEREVARALGVGAGTAHRLRERLARSTAPAAPIAADAGGQSSADVIALPTPVRAAQARTEPHPELEALRGGREQLAARIADLEAKARQARAAVTQVEYERRENLAGGGDGTGFASRRRAALDTAEDLEASAGVLAEDLAALGARITTVEAELAAEAERAEVARLLVRAREIAADLPEIVAGVVADFGGLPVTWEAAQRVLEEVAARRERIDAGKLTPEQRAGQAAHAARVQREWDEAQQRQAAGLAEAQAKLLERRDPNTYLPARGERAFTGPPPYVFNSVRGA